MKKGTFAINIEIPVRVCDGNTFAEFFRINDFEFFGDRRHQ